MSVHVRPGDSGPAATQVVSLLRRAGVLGDAGAPPDRIDVAVERAVRAFQQQRGLTVDGVVGPATFRRLDEARWRLGDRILVHRPADEMAGDDVSALQQRLRDLGFGTARVDGYFGADTRAAVAELQRNLGLPPDGTCGPATLQALARLRPIVSGGAPDALRAAEHIRDVGPRLSGKTVVVDVGRDHRLPATRAEASDAVLHDVAARVEGRLVAMGVTAHLTTPRHEPADLGETERARFANRTGADLLCSLALDVSSNEAAGGVSSYFYGDARPETWSSAGERFAGLVQREVVARTGLTDLRSHPKTWDLLRHSAMPAVRLDVGYLSHEPDRRRLQQPTFRDRLAEAVVVAVQRFYLTPEVDSPTGVLTFDDLRAAYQT